MRSKDIKRGTANCPVLPESADDATHVIRKSPLQMKREELADRALTNANENRTRAKSTAAKRKSGNTRPL